MRSPIGILAVAVLGSTGITQSKPPYVGAWRIDPTKSDFGQMTMKYAPLANGDYRVTVASQSYTLSSSGKESSTPWGSTVTGKRIDASTFEMMWRLNGKLMSADTLRVTPDGQTLTVDSKVPRPSAPSAHEQMTLRRVGTGSGFSGEWQPTKLSSSAPARLTIAARDNGLMVRLDDDGGECDAKFDGKDVAGGGAIWSKGWSCSVARNSDGGFDFSLKREGKLMYRSSFAVSADGKTLTETGGPVGGNGKLKLVYARQ